MISSFAFSLFSSGATAVARIDQDGPKIIDGIAAALGAAIVKGERDAPVLLPKPDAAVVRRIAQFDVGIPADLRERGQIEAAQAMLRDLDLGVQAPDLGMFHLQVEMALAAVDVLEGACGPGVQFPVVDLLHLSSPQFAQGLRTDLPYLDRAGSGRRGFLGRVDNRLISRAG